ncbi:MAG: histidine phosphatase family protein, partial [Clostridia bacterium]|nr:histidine phosphatase family protein [Clostridia bacterium]
ALVVCHGAVIGFLRAAAEGLPLNDVRKFIPKNAELCEFTPEMMERIAAYGKEQ